MINGRQKCWEHFKKKGWFKEFKTYKDWFYRDGEREEEKVEIKLKQLEIDCEDESLEKLAQSELEGL